MTLPTIWTKYPNEINGVFGVMGVTPKFVKTFSGGFHHGETVGFLTRGSLMRTYSYLTHDTSDSNDRVYKSMGYGWCSVTGVMGWGYNP